MNFHAGWVYLGRVGLALVALVCAALAIGWYEALEGRAKNNVRAGVLVLIVILGYLFAIGFVN